MSVEKILSQSALHSLDLLTRNEYKEPEETQAPVQTVTREDLEKMVSSINDFLHPSNTYIKFQLHEKLNEYYVTVVDNHTEEVIREIPSKKWLDIYAAMTEFIGLILDRKI
ncbi:flagellar protein FlaG [Metabacillus fastidiosus]|uniref:flagellar protein FlaG n=1 Tax=Metabacillus fastidiosus TaxID=1458 RepID=UPI003D2B0B46